MNNYQQYHGFGQSYAPRIVGRAVSSVAEVGVGEVPTDGSAGWFPALDGSCVWSKRWNGNGTIETVRFVPEKVEDPVDELTVLKERVEALEASIAKKATRKETDLEND